MNQDDVLIICENCGAKNQSGNAYCGSCGQKLGTHILEVQDNPQEENYGRSSSGDESYGGERGWEQGGRTSKPIYNFQFDINDFDERFFDPADREVSSFLGKNQAYYFTQFNKMKDFNKNTSWNWGAFFFPVIWFAYRKMYLLAVIIAVISTVLNSMLSSAFVGNLIVGVALGLFANIKYLEYIQNTFIEADNLQSESSRRSYLEEKSGTSTLALVIAIHVTTGAILIPLFIFSSLIGMSFMGMGMRHW